MQQHLPSLRGTTLLLARGGASGHVTSSLTEACGVALRLGSHGVDVDAAVESGLVRLLHRTDAGLLRRMRRPGATGPTLDEFFAALPGAAIIPVFMRLRDDSVATVATAVAARPLIDAALLPRFVLTASRGIPAPAPSKSFACYVSSSLAEMPYGPERFFAAARTAGWCGVVLPDRDWTGGVVTLAHRFELEAFADAVVQEHRAVSLMRMGIDVISSAWPDRLTSAVLEFERTQPRES